MHARFRGRMTRHVLRPAAVVAATVAAAVLVLSFGQSAPVQAANASVNVGQGGLLFGPTSVNIAAGESVTWTWLAGRHNVDAADGSFDSGIQSAPGTPFTHTFPTAGTFFYYCEVHATAADATDEGIAAGKMAGKVVVSAQTQGTPTATATGTATATASATASATATAAPSTTATVRPSSTPTTAATAVAATPAAPKTGQAGLADDSSTNVLVVIVGLGLMVAFTAGARRLSARR